MARKTLLVVLSIPFLVVAYFVLAPKVAAAATITVNSKADTTVDDGVCTLREAIFSANNDTVSGATTGECSAGSGADTIVFNIMGTPDFTNGGQNGYTITLNSSLPQITNQVTINGYSQPGALANTALSPLPLNGRLLIEINGGNLVTSNGIQFTDNSDNSIVQGLVINRFASGDAILLWADNIRVQGNYIGTDPLGQTARPNQVGVNAVIQDPSSGDGALIGGLSPNERNLISGNTEGTTGTASYPGDGWVFQGNYIGVAADGVTPIANSTDGGSGAISVDEVSDVVIGGSHPQAINVFGASKGHGIAPLETTNIIIENNYIGLAYDGTTVLGNVTNGSMGSGITISQTNTFTIKNNRIAGWKTGGIGISTGNSGGIVSNNQVFQNESAGISVSGSSNIVIGEVGAGNVVEDNVGVGIVVYGFSDFAGPTNNVRIQANIVDGTINSLISSVGVLVQGDPTNILIGGTNAGEGNIVRNGEGAGIGVASFTATAFSVTITPEKVSILGNIVHTNDEMGIDVGAFSDTTLPFPDGQPDIFENLGPTPNDSSDSDTGPNGYINFPVVNRAQQNLNKLTVNLSLDVADSPSNQYRVELFANDQADPSGYGEGQEFLGYAMASNGSNQTITIDLPNDIDLTNKVLSATTTAIDNTTVSGFGATSEFSLVSEVDVLATTGNPSGTLANAGQTTTYLLIIVGALMLSGGVYSWRKSKSIWYGLVR